MSKESRVRKSLLNAKVNLLFYVIILVTTFFSRKLFLERLGDEFIGMISTLANLLGLLNLAEMGVGAAVGYMLYKPLVEGEHEKTYEIISVFGYIYQKIGYVLVAAAVILGIFLPFILPDAPFQLSLIYFAYFSYVLSALFSYFINYRQLLLDADQKTYVVTAYYQGANVIRLLIQMWVVYQVSNPYYWVTIEIVFSVIYSIILNMRIDKTYPWLKPSIKSGKVLLKNYPQLLKYTRQIFVHRLSGTVLSNLSPLFVYSFTSLTIVAYYTNYMIVFQKIQQLITQILGGADAGIGQLVAEGKQEKSFGVFNELFTLRYFIAGTIITTTAYTINPFISLWLGDDYLLSDITVGILLINLFIMLTRSTVDSFINAYGLFYDVWAPLVEAMLNIFISILGGFLWGLNGVLVGTTISLIIIIGIWKPYFLFHKGLNKTVWLYWKNLLGKLILLTIAWYITHIVTSYIVFKTNTYIYWGVKTLLISTLYAFTLFILMYSFLPSMRLLSKRIYNYGKLKSGE